MSCDNKLSVYKQCTDECQNEGMKICDGNSVMLCEEKYGCLLLKKVQDCQNSCSNGVCQDNQNTDCNPVCEEWQTCENSVCVTSQGHCADDSECNDGFICVNHECKNQNTLTKKRAVVIGAGGTLKSNNFKMKVSLGKVSSIKDLTSSSYKLKTGNIVIKKGEYNDFIK
jgi:hypothetical protein